MKIFNKKIEFSKLVIGALVSTYFIVLILGIYAVIIMMINSPECSVNALIALFSYVGTVNAISIPFYLTTKRDENLQKYPDIQTIDQYKEINNIETDMGENLSNINNDEIPSK